MSSKSTRVFSLLVAFLFTFLFYKIDLGLNLFIVEISYLLYAAFTRIICLKEKLSAFITCSLLLSAFSLILVHSDLAFVMNSICLLLFVGVHLNLQANSLTTSLFMGISSLGGAQKKFLSAPPQETNSSTTLKSRIWSLRLYILPLICILIFTVFYRNSNPIFEEFMSYIDNLLPSIDWIQNINLMWIITFFLCLILSNFLLIPTINKLLVKNDQLSSTELKRDRLRSLRKFTTNGLSNQLKSAVFLFIGLNFFLLILNVSDIYLVWLKFSWQNGTLKDFVHEGTFYLLITIGLSVLLVLYYFKNNLNFYSKNKFLKILCTIWLAQNIILTLSVFIRNYWYINYFSLAHLRIGLIIFLVLTIIGLITVIIKVNRIKSFFYLLKMNSLAMFCILLISSFVDWDIVIAKYNTNHLRESYYHLDFMSTLAYKTLPLVDLTEEELSLVKTKRYSTFSFERGGINSAQYQQRIEFRKQDFIEHWEKRHLLEWNLPDQLAYNKIIGQ